MTTFKDPTLSKLVRDRLEGTMFWVDSQGVHHRIEYMTPGYALNCILWLERHEETLFDDALIDAHLHGGSVPAHSTPRTWLHGQPQVRALFSRLDGPHRRALVLGKPACARCNDFIDQGPVKYNGAPYHWGCRNLQQNDDHRVSTLQRRGEFATGLRECANQLRMVPELHGLINMTLAEQGQMVDIVTDLQDISTGSILVLGVYLSRMAEETLRRRQEAA